MRVGAGTSDDWMADDAGLELCETLLREVGLGRSGHQERCKPEAADCISGYMLRRVRCGAGGYSWL